MKILIVEDDEGSASFLKVVIRKISDDLIWAKNGVEAVQACLDNRDIDLVLMDLKMPVMDGYEATRQIRQFNANVIIIAQTAFAMTGDNEKAIEAGCNDYITKPIKRDQLTGLMQKYFI